MQFSLSVIQDPLRAKNKSKNDNNNNNNINTSKNTRISGFLCEKLIKKVFPGEKNEEERSSRKVQTQAKSQAEPEFMVNYASETDPTVSKDAGALTLLD